MLQDGAGATSLEAVTLRIGEYAAHIVQHTARAAVQFSSQVQDFLPKQANDCGAQPLGRVSLVHGKSGEPRCAN